MAYPHRPIATDRRENFDDHLHRVGITRDSRRNLNFAWSLGNLPADDHVVITLMTIASGTRLGRYEIRSKLGEGGMGEVYLALDTELDRTVAIKILPEALASNQQRLQRFIQEAGWDDFLARWRVHLLRRGVG